MYKSHIKPQTATNLSQKQLIEIFDHDRVMFVLHIIVLAPDGSGIPHPTRA